MKFKKSLFLSLCLSLVFGCQTEEEESVDLDEIVFLEEDDSWEGISFEERHVLHEDPPQEQMIIESNIAQNEPLTP